MRVSDLINAIAVQYCLQTSSGTAELLFSGNKFTPLPFTSLIVSSSGTQSGRSDLNTRSDPESICDSREKPECLPSTTEGKGLGSPLPLPVFSSLDAYSYNRDLHALAGQHWSRIAAMVYGTLLSDSLLSCTQRSSRSLTNDGKDRSNTFLRKSVFLSPSQVEQHCQETLRNQFKGDFQLYMVHYRDLICTMVKRDAQNILGDTVLSEADGGGQEGVRSSCSSTLLLSPLFSSNDAGTQEYHLSVRSLLNDGNYNSDSNSTRNRKGKGDTSASWDATNGEEDAERDPTSPCGKSSSVREEESRRNRGPTYRSFYSLAAPLLDSASSPSQRKIVLERQFQMEKERDRAPYFSTWCRGDQSVGSPASRMEGGRDDFLSSRFSPDFPASCSKERAVKREWGSSGGAVAYSTSPSTATDFFATSSWTTVLSPEQRSFLSRLRHTPLSPELLISFIQEFSLVDGAPVFFDDVGPEMMMEFHGIQAGPYRKVIAAPLSLLTMKRCIAETRYRYDHYPHLFTHLSSYNDNGEWSLSESQLHGNYPNTFSDTAFAKDFAPIVQQKGLNATSVSPTMLPSDRFPERELKTYDYQLLTLMDLERMIWHIAANCVFFNAPETSFRPTATKFGLACSRIIQEYCLKQLNSPSLS